MFLSRLNEISGGCEAAQKFNALVIFGEHRYYGDALPFGSSSFDHDKVGYLSMEQALADYAVLVTDLKIQFKATESKVVAFGGSYGGMLSAYMRFKYPNVIDVALAASAPIYMTTFCGSERDFFFTAVTKDFLNADANCPGYVITAFKMIEMLKNQGAEGLAELSKTFKLCKPLKSTEQIPHMLGWIRNSFTTLAMGDYPYPTDFLAPLPGHPVNLACKMMASASSKVEGLAEVTALVYNGTNGTLTCLDPDTEYIECADPTGCGLGPDSLAWDYQTMKCCISWLATTQLEYSLAVGILCNELEVFSLRLKGFNLYLICGTNVVCKCGLVHPVALEISGFLCRETLQ